MFTQFQKNNLLQFLNRVPITGYDEANALLELVRILQEPTANIPLDSKKQSAQSQNQIPEPSAKQ